MRAYTRIQLFEFVASVVRAVGQVRRAGRVMVRHAGDVVRPLAASPRAPSGVAAFAESRNRESLRVTLYGGGGSVIPHLNIPLARPQLVSQSSAVSAFAQECERSVRLHASSLDAGTSARLTRMVLEDETARSLPLHLIFRLQREDAG